MLVEEASILTVNFPPTGSRLILSTSRNRSVAKNVKMAISLYIFVFVATLAVFTEALNSNLCNLESCRQRGKTHTTCLYAPKPSQKCGKVIATGLSQDQIREIVDVHNMYRKKVGSGQESRGNPGPQPGSRNIGPLKWSNNLAFIAQVWADQCDFKHDGCRDLPNEKVGQNIAISEVYGQEPKPITDMVTSWYNEVKDFDRNMVKSFQVVGGPQIGHYTQMVWGKTTHVGCGFIRYNNDDDWVSSYLVCNYGPAGNFIGQPVY